MAAAIQGPRMPLSAWQRSRLPAQRARVYPDSTLRSVTVVAYHFWDQPSFDTELDRLEGAIYETWETCGALPTTLVVNRRTPALDRLVGVHDGRISVQPSAGLRSGDLASMSVDCNANLHRYFETEYVLIVQNDGFPLRRGLAGFVGPYDFIGAPFIRPTRRNRWLGLWPRFAVGNGGFSLRSHDFCERAAYYWARRYRHLLPHSGRYAREDAYCCVVLPMLERSFRTSMRIADWAAGRTFAYDALCDAPPGQLPFGFHGEKAFACFQNLGMLGQAPEGDPEMIRTAAAADEGRQLP